MAHVRSVCVYCGSSLGLEGHHREAASRLGRLLGGARIRVVFGGGNVGLMGLVAEGALAAGGEVFGIIPRHLDRTERAHRGLTRLYLVDTMHERKQKMFQHADAFVILPGGLGTLDETFEIITWKLLGLHDKAILIVNAGGYWDPLLGLIRHVIASGFAGPATAGLFATVDRVEAVIPALRAATAPRTAAHIEQA